jgi:hypothetical protein
MDREGDDRGCGSQPLDHIQKLVKPIPIVEPNFFNILQLFR